MLNRILYLFIIATFLLISPAVNSQKKVMGSVNLGASIPSKDYAAADFSKSESGFAKTGVNLSVLFGYKFTKVLGAGVMASGGFNNLDQERIKNSVVEIIRSALPDAALIVETKQWSYGGLMAGPIITIPLGRTIEIDGRFMIGYMYISSPEINIQINPGMQNSGYISQQRSKSGAFGFDAGGSVRYNIPGKKFILINIDYLSATPEFTDQQTITSINNSIETEVNSFEQNISMINLTLGFGYFIR